MSESNNPDRIRNEVMNQIERSERNFKLAFYAAALLEGLFMIAFLFAADFRDRTHVLILIATVGSYSIIVLGMVALGGHINRGLLRILKAVELLKDRSDEGRR